LWWVLVATRLGAFTALWMTVAGERVSPKPSPATIFFKTL
jgi:hypothetical protein